MCHTENGIGSNDYIPVYMGVLSKKATIILLYCAVLLCLAAVGLFLFLRFRQTHNSRPLAYKRPFLCGGTYSFVVAASDDTKGLIHEGVLSPCDPPLHGLQTLTLTTHPDIETLEATIITDTQTTPIVLIKNPENNTQWRAMWTNGDTYNNTYTIHIKGRMDGKETEIPITFR